MEVDPTGRSPQDAGAKLDSGKVRPGLVLGGFARALWAVSEVGTVGANKYSDNGWVSVPNGESRYDDAGMRHWLKDKMGEKQDDDSKLRHLAHEAWNALAVLDLALREQEAKRVPKFILKPGTLNEITVNPLQSNPRW
ncbi:dATP/dGTP diphosphohydrolase domain-containing protein [Shewanella vesiculosa]|uniref:dATP/dGTP diphosphohydrolase domain-containing protein n=1 Tax=Shewanella vesiculosa TaxID=518738 RepID=UPI001FB2342D|nr:dATP/dGTP diphosphohydrolase domain-containing protein [Shewanella vesiculosa]